MLVSLLCRNGRVFDVRITDGNCRFEAISGRNARGAAMAPTWSRDGTLAKSRSSTQLIDIVVGSLPFTVFIFARFIDALFQRCGRGAEIL